MKRVFTAVLSLTFVAMSVYLLWQNYRSSELREKAEKTPFSLSVIERTFANYHSDLQPLALRFGIEEEYLLALIALESSGKKIVPHRFEAHIFQKLELLKNGKISRMEHVKTDDLRSAKVSDLRELASSWGPFQIMGYKCIELDIPLQDLKTDKTLESSVRWIKKDYGGLLNKQDYQNAFHYHNTGRKYPRIGPPRTHDPAYVPKGLKYLSQFKRMLIQKSAVQ